MELKHSNTKQLKYPKTVTQPSIKQKIIYANSFQNSLNLGSLELAQLHANRTSFDE